MNIVALRGAAKSIAAVSHIINLSTEQLDLARRIDAHVSHYPETAFGTRQLLTTTDAYMSDFQHIMDSTTRVQMDYLCQQYPGLYRFGRLLGSLVQGIADGIIAAPEDH